LGIQDPVDVGNNALPKCKSCDEGSRVFRLDEIVHVLVGVERCLCTIVLNVAMVSWILVKTIGLVQISRNIQVLLGG